MPNSKDKPQGPTADRFEHANPVWILGDQEYWKVFEENHGICFLHHLSVVAVEVVSWEYSGALSISLPPSSTLNFLRASSHPGSTSLIQYRPPARTQRLNFPQHKYRPSINVPIWNYEIHVQIKNSTISRAFLLFENFTRFLTHGISFIPQIFHALWNCLILSPKTGET